MVTKAKAPKSIIDIVLNKLQSSIHTQLFGSPSPNDINAIRRRATLVANGESALRILHIKGASLMPKKDTPMVRAALIIDYLGRNASNGDNNISSNDYLRTTIPVSMLAKAVGFQTNKDVKKLETMQTLIASYLDGTSIGKKKAVRRKKDQNKYPNRGRNENPFSMQQPDGAPSSLSSSFIPSSKGPSISPTNLIRDLCIQLGPMIPDAEFATSYSTRIFETLTNMDGIEQSKTNTSKRRFSKYELRRDMERHQEYYEAACFYLAVKKSEGESSHLKNTKKKKGPKKANIKAFLGDDDGLVGDVKEEEDEDGEDERPLNELDVIRASNLLEGTFKTVLAYVRDWTEGISIPLHDLDDVQGDKAGEEAKSLFKVEGVEITDESGGRVKIEPLDNAFERWKRKVLQDAKYSVKKKMKGDNSDWLKIAADEVLRKAG